MDSGQRRGFSSSAGGVYKDPVLDMTTDEVVMKLKGRRASKELVEYVEKKGLNGSHVEAMTFESVRLLSDLPDLDKLVLLGMADSARKDRDTARKAANISKSSLTPTTVSMQLGGASPDMKTFADQEAFLWWLQEARLSALIGPDGRAAHTLAELQDGLIYTGRPSTTDPTARLDLIDNEKRSAADYALTRELSLLESGPVDFMAHDLNLFDAKHRKLGDVDSLFLTRRKSSPVHFLCERKSSVRKSVVKQMKKTVKAYKKQFLTPDQRETVKVVSVLFVQGGVPVEDLEEVRMEGVHVLTPAMIFYPAKAAAV